MSPSEHGSDCYCAVSPLIHALGKRHALSIISFLGSQKKTVRFSAIQERFPGLSSSTLAARLDELEASGLVSRIAFDDENKVQYRLTHRGRSLQQTLASLFPPR